MSKELKNMTVEEYSRRLKGVNDAVLVNVIGMDSLSTFNFRKELRAKNLNLLVVKGSLAKRATEGTSLVSAFEGDKGDSGSLAVVWGGDDFVSLAKEIVEIQKKPAYEKCKSRGGVMDGEKLSAEKLAEVAKWPNRIQQIGLLVGQILAPGANLLSQIKAPGGLLMSQVKKKSEGEEAPAA
jgi:large subunit ribosomal protein L10